VVSFVKSSPDWYMSGSLTGQNLSKQTVKSDVFVATGDLRSDPELLKNKILKKLKSKVSKLVPGMSPLATGARKTADF